MSTSAHRNDDGPTVRAADPSTHLSLGETMENVMQQSEARAVSVAHASVGLKSSAVIRDTDGKLIAVTFAGFPRDRALALTNALVRLMNGASVFDGADLGVIRGALWTAKGEAGSLAPEQQSATNAIGCIESALAHLEVAS